MKGIKLIVGLSVKTTDAGIEFNQRDLIIDAAEYTGQCDAGTERMPYPSGWSGFTQEDCVTDPEARLILDRFPYPNVVGKIAYVVRCTRYDGLWLVSVLQRHLKNYGPVMIKMALRMVRFLYTTRATCLIFRRGYPGDLHPLVSMVDASFASSDIDGSSHAGSIHFWNGCPIAATSKNQRPVALNTMESEFMGANDCARAALWKERLATGFGMKVPLPMPIMEDNTSAIYLSRKPSLNGSNTRHMRVRWHWLQQQVMDELVVLHHL